MQQCFLKYEPVHKYSASAPQHSNIMNNICECLMIAELLDALELFVADEADVARPSASTLNFLNLESDVDI